MKAGDRPLNFAGHHGDPFVIDWDGDGDLDILSGSSEGGVQWAENRAGAGKPPRLEPFRSIIPHGPQLDYGSILRDEDLKGPLTDTRIWVDDVNADGKLDILVGDLAPLISPADGLGETQYKKRFEEWTKARSEASDKMRTAVKDEKEQQKAQQEIQDLYQQRSQFMKEERTGFVWLYLQK